MRKISSSVVRWAAGWWRWLAWPFRACPEGANHDDAYDIARYHADGGAVERATCRRCGRVLLCVPLPGAHLADISVSDWVPEAEIVENLKRMGKLWTPPAPPPKAEAHPCGG